MHISNQINVLQYLGNKFSLLPWLYKKLPYAHSWVDLFGGSGNVTANRLPAPIETYNDINLKVVNFFEVLRTDQRAFVELLELTPHSRWEYENAWYSADDTKLEAARKFFVRTQQSFFATGAQNQLKGWLSSTQQSRRNISQSTALYLSRVDGLNEVAERFRRVQIECRPFEYLLKAYDSSQTLFYADPPYDEEMRSGRNDYEFDFTVEDHVRLHDLGKKVEGKIAVSGYDSEFMKDLYRDYYFIPGPNRKNTMSERKVRECLWTNYDPEKINSGQLF